MKSPAELFIENELLPYLHSEKRFMSIIEAGSVQLITNYITLSKDKWQTPRTISHWGELSVSKLEEKQRDALLKNEYRPIEKFEQWRGVPTIECKIIEIIDRLNQLEQKK